MNKLLERYLDIVNFLADFLGEDAEVVLHDMTDLENSVVAIRNGYISGREAGAPATDLVLKILKNGKYKDRKYLANYKGSSKSGNVLKSATYFIRDEKEKIVGMLCINMNVNKLLQMQTHLDRMLGYETENENNEPISEVLSQSAAELTLNNIENVVNSSGIPPERMDQDEKIAVVNKLNEMGIFLIKGAVSQVATELKVSEATVYRYLGKLKKS